jgi:hypothetical protein
VTQRLPPWIEGPPPWEEPAPDALCAEAGVERAQVPVLHLLGVFASIPELLALRAGRYVPLFAEGPSRDEAVRALANLCVALGDRADARSADHALSLATHPALDLRPIERLSRALRDGAAPASFGTIPLAYVSVLGASDVRREGVARALRDAPSVEEESLLALHVGGGDYGTWREHYRGLCEVSEPGLALRVARAWFDWVLARRFSGLDALRALAADPSIDPASAWLAESGFFLFGDEGAKARMVDSAERVFGAVTPWIPRVLAGTARDMAEAVRTPLALRWSHLKAAASRDHASAAIRHWLAAASVQLDDEDDAHAGALGPEPSRAGRAAIEARAAAGEFLLDWFVPDRPAREDVDAYARRIVRVYHRLRGARLFARAIDALAPQGPAKSPAERLLWEG